MNLRRAAALLRPICPTLGGIRFCSGAVKPNENNAFLVNTMTQVKRLEAQGLPRNHAEAITSIVCDVLNDSLKNIDSKQKWSESLQDLKLLNFKLDVQSSQEHYFSSLQRSNAKLKDYSEKMLCELRSYIHEEADKQKMEVMETITMPDRDINALKAQLEATKFTVVKYCIGTIFSVIVVSLAVAHLNM